RCAALLRTGLPAHGAPRHRDARTHADDRLGRGGRGRLPGGALDRRALVSPHRSRAAAPLRRPYLSLRLSLALAARQGPDRDAHRRRADRRLDPLRAQARSDPAIPMKLRIALLLTLAALAAGLGVAERWGA